MTALLDVLEDRSASLDALIATVRADCPRGARYRREIARLESGLGDSGNSNSR